MGSRMVPRTLGPEEVAERVERVSGLEREFRVGLAVIATAWVKMAGLAWQLHEERAWQVLGYETLGEWLAQPDVTVERRQFFRLVQTWHEFVVRRKLDPHVLDGIEVSKIEPILPALRAGDVSAEDALADARTLGVRDVRDKYRRASGEGGPADEDSELVSCPICGSRVSGERLSSPAP